MHPATIVEETGLVGVADVVDAGAERRVRVVRGLRLTCAAERQYVVMKTATIMLLLLLLAEEKRVMTTDLL